MLKINLKNL